MKRWIGLLALLVLVSSCGKKGGGELRILNWADYMPDSIVKDFEDREKVKITLDTTDDPDAMLSKLKAGGDSEYDILITSDYLIGQLGREGTILELDKSKISNLSGLDPQFADPAYDPGGKHSVVYQWGTTGLVYREDLVKGAVDSWAVLFDPKKQAGDFLLLTEMREQMGGAFKYLGDSVNTTDSGQIDKAKNLLIEAKKRSKGFAGGTDAVQQVLGGNVGIAVGYSGDAIRAIEQDKRMHYVIPKEGATLWTDNLTILKKSPNAELAYKFINYLLEPETAAKLSNGIGYGTPVPAAMDKIDAKDNPVVYPPASVRSKLELIKDLGPDTDKLNAAWADIRAR